MRSLPISGSDLFGIFHRLPLLLPSLLLSFLLLPLLSPSSRLPPPSSSYAEKKANRKEQRGSYVVESRVENIFMENLCCILQGFTRCCAASSFFFSFEI